MSSKDQFTGILEGWDDAIKSHYGLQNALTTTTAARAAYGANKVDLKKLFGELFGIIESKLRDDVENVGEPNWGLREAEKISEHNTSIEKCLEKRVAQLGPRSNQAPELGPWSNQVPAASGYKDANSNRKNSIDLVYEIESAKRYAFVELKVHRGSGSPFYAAYEILSYGFLYLLTRSNKALLERLSGKPLLKSESIQLIVLAPSDNYYDATEIGVLKVFEGSIDAALREFAGGKVPGLEMGFEFRRFSNMPNLEEIRSFDGFAPGPFGERLNS